MPGVNFYSVLTTTAIVASSSGTGYYPFLFNARSVTIENLGSKTIWAGFDACSTAASTSDPLITTCADHTLKVFTFPESAAARKVTIFATSTVAGDLQFGITAIG
ncbi:MAG TPA: hypothetical protein DCP69_04865 [Candidatus Omnitrophica bacterium]|nr:hypothetical protein [Candidatus Omnitrophota bacterium]